MRSIKFSDVVIFLSIEKFSNWIYILKQFQKEFSLELKQIIHKGKIFVLKYIEPILKVILKKKGWLDPLIKSK